MVSGLLSKIHCVHNRNIRLLLELTKVCLLILSREALQQLTSFPYPNIYCTPTGTWKCISGVCNILGGMETPYRFYPELYSTLSSMPKVSRTVFGFFSTVRFELKKTSQHRNKSMFFVSNYVRKNTLAY